MSYTYGVFGRKKQKVFIIVGDEETIRKLAKKNKFMILYSDVEIDNLKIEE